jgi:hypothetical protein
MKRAKPTAVRPSLIATLASSVAAAGLMFAPAPVTNAVRVTVRDAVRPGQWAVQRAIDQAAELWSRSGAPAASAVHPDLNQQNIQAELADVQLRYRRLQIENALLHEKLERVIAEGISAYTGTAGRPLVVPELLEATVFGTEQSPAAGRGLLIDRGGPTGAIESAFVLDAPGPLVDQGEDAGLLTGQPVYAGRCVVGRIAAVGRWSSTVQRVTDAGYRGRAQLARQTPQGAAFGAEGILEGQGEPVCRLKFVSSTEPVSVGDEVYTGGRTGRLPYPMYYGRVTKAELKPGAPHWEIEVQPAVTEAVLKTVQVLREKLNPERVLGE